MERIVDRANDRAERAVRDVGREIRLARRDRNLSLEEVAKASGMTISTVSRIERARSPEVSVLNLARLAEGVGLELSVRVFPGGSPIRDHVHAALLARLRDELHSSLRWRLEVPLPIPGDARAWDAVITGSRWRYGVEAETAPRDVQALSRRLSLKLRDGEVDGILLVLPNTRRVRELLAASRGMLEESFPVPGNLALERLRQGIDPGGSSIIVL